MSYIIVGREKLQSTPSVGRATFLTGIFALNFTISIHALRGEGDNHQKKTGKDLILISIHALRGEGDSKSA